MDNANRTHTEEEIEQFVSMAAHNLRQSLRDIAAFSQLLSETCAPRLDAEAAGFLAHIRTGAADMQSLLTDIVDYWATAPAGPAASVDLEAALSQALLCAEQQLVERGAIVTYDPLPTVTGDFVLLTKTLHHLIRNAIAYCETPAVPEIHISSRRQDSEWIVSVSDNGPGIAPEFQTRVFEPFRRLHGKEHPGNGLGLAFSKRAIEWLGGHIWIDSAPGAGSTFHFALPAA